MTVATCGTCRFAAPAFGAGRKIDFSKKICKLNPPTPMLVPIPDQNGNMQPSIQYIWPMLEIIMNCGQWQESRAETLLPGEVKPEEAQKAD